MAFIRLAISIREANGFMLHVHGVTLLIGLASMCGAQLPAATGIRQRKTHHHSIVLTDWGGS